MKVSEFQPQLYHSMINCGRTNSRMADINELNDYHLMKNFVKTN